MKPVETTGPLGALRRAEDGVLRLMSWVITLSMSGMVAVVFLQIISRYVFSMSLSWSEEVARLLFICLVFMGAAVLARHQKHLTVTIIVDLFEPHLRHGLAACASFIGLVCGWHLAQGGWAVMMREWDQLTPALQFPMGFIYLVIFISVCLLMIWQFIVMLINAGKAVRGDTR